MNFSGFNFELIEPKPGNPAKLPGSDGVAAPGGYLYTGERNPRLQGDAKWVEFANMIRGTLIVAGSYRAYDTFARSVKWTAEPNPLGGRKGRKMADLCTDGLIEAPMPKPWSAVAGKATSGAKFHGFSLHAWAGRKRDTPGRPWVFTNLEHRPQHTIAQWIKPTEDEPWVGVIQRTKSGGTYPIARSRLFHVSDDTFSDEPTGAGYLQHLLEHADHVRVFEKLEGVGFQSNLAGMPVSRAPLGALRRTAMQALQLSDPLDEVGASKVAAFINAQIKFLTDFMEGHVRTPDLGLTLDSMPYMATGDGKTTPSSIYQWSLDVVKATGLNLVELASAINRVGREMARVMNTEWMLMGDSEGARSVHGDKTTMFLLGINSMVGLVGHYATAQLVWPMTVLNGMDPHTCAPRLRPQPIPMESIESVCRALQLLSVARGPLPPQWGGTDVILARADLPPLPEIELDTDAMLPRGGGPGPKATPATTPDPAGQGDDGEDDDQETPSDNPGAGATA